MKKFDLVCLNNNTLYKNYGIEKNMHGIIIEISQNYVSVMFFNPHNLGEATLIDINKNDISIDKENLPDYIKVELENNIERIKSYSNKIFAEPKFKEFDKVMLTNEDKKYLKFGLHKGDIGFIMDNNMADNCVEVDFPYLDENNKHFGETFSINIDDLKIIK